MTGIHNLVILESPYGGDVELNVRYAKACMGDCLRRQESPYASHLLLPGTLDDDVPEQRDLGIQAGFLWRKVADYTVVYTDLGISKGMAQGIAHACSIGTAIKYRRLPGWPG